MSGAVIKAPRTGAVESFGGATTKRLRLPPGDVADLVFVFTTLESEAGLRSSDVRFGETSQPTVVCERCGRTFIPEASRARTRWRVVGGRGEKREKRLPWEEESDAGPDKVVYSIARFCDRVCRRENQRAVDALHAAWRSPALADERPPAGELAVADGRRVRVYEGVTVRRLPPGPDDHNEKDTMEVKGASQGGPTTDLLELEDFVFRRTPRLARAWACAATLQRLVRAGDARTVFVLHRLYGSLDPNARYQLWGRGARLAQFDPREVAAIAPMTEAVRTIRFAPGDGDHAPIDRALHAYTAGPIPGEKRAAHQAREREAAEQRREWLTVVGRQAESLIAGASVAYRTARRAF